MCLTSQPLSMNSQASQSSSSGCAGRSPCEPRSSSVLDEPVAEELLPEAVHEDAGGQRIVAARRANGPGRAASGRVRWTAGVRRDNAATAGWTTSPLSSIQLPRGRIRTVRGFSLWTLTRHLGRRSANALRSSLARATALASSSTLLRPLDGRIEPGEGLPVLGRGDDHAGLATADDALLDVGEERAQRVEVPHRERVELVIVALGAARWSGRARRCRWRARGRPACGPRSPSAARRLPRSLSKRRLNAEPTRVSVSASGSRSPAICSTVNRSKGLLRVEAPDHPVAIEPDVAGVVAVVADRVGVADHVEPADRHALAVVRAGEQAVDESLVGVGRSSSTNASTSSGVGGRPIRSNGSRRIRVRRSASGDGSRPTASSRRRTRISMASGPSGTLRS